MPNVFISYSSRDLQQAEEIRNALEQDRISCWMDYRDISGGKDYTNTIPEAIDKSDVFVLILSENATESPWVARELRTAIDRKKSIIPYQIQDFTLNQSFQFALSGVQILFAYKEPGQAREALVRQIRDGGIRAEENRSHWLDRLLPGRRVTAPYLGPAKCPACGSQQLEILSRKIGYYRLSEKLMFPLRLVLTGAVEIMLLLMLTGILYGYLDLDYNTEQLLVDVTALLGLLVGWAVSGAAIREWIRRLRIRRGILPRPLRCTECRKQFLVDKDHQKV